jgi:hypothetical protein
VVWVQYQQNPAWPARVEALPDQGRRQRVTFFGEKVGMKYPQTADTSTTVLWDTLVPEAILQLMMHKLEREPALLRLWQSQTTGSSKEARRILRGLCAPTEDLD